MASSEPKSAETRIQRIQRSLSKARKIAGPHYTANKGEVDFLLEQARILAALEVAAALRGDQEDAEA